MPPKVNSAPEEETEQEPQPQEKREPQFGTIDWIDFWAETEGELSSPIDVSITGSIKYFLTNLSWYNFDVFPHKIKITNTGYTVLLGAKWRAERPYLEGGPFHERYVFSQMHFHWGANMTEGSDHTVDKRRHPGELQITFFKADYLTQNEALKYPDGVVIMCYMIKFGVNPDKRLILIQEGFPRIQEAQTSTKIGPWPMSHLIPTFYEDYFLYWGRLDTHKGESYVVRWLIPRITIYADMQQMKEFRKLWNPWDEPNLRNFRPLQETANRHIFFINAHWNQYNSLLPIPRNPPPSISCLSEAYTKHPERLPQQNRENIEDKL